MEAIQKFPKRTTGKRHNKLPSRKKNSYARKELQDFGDNAPTYIETNMAIAYAASMRSSCLKRKVGAVIVDITEDVFSSGYNEVPAANF